MPLHIESPKTVYISFLGEMPKLFELYDLKDGRVYYFRHLDGKTPRIKFNITHEGSYDSDTDFCVERETEVKTPYNLPKLPSPDRSRVKPLEVVINESLEGTPACIYTDEGVIEVGEWFLSMPKQIQGFLLFHEQAHLLFSDEHDCDLFALVASLRKGYNRSMCMYALTHYLSRSKENTGRIYKLFYKVQETQKAKL